MAGENTRFKPREGHWNWGGGYYYDADGYKRVLVDGGGYRPEHVVVMERHIGRPIRRDECVHHINGVVDDNRLDNLQLMTRS